MKAKTFSGNAHTATDIKVINQAVADFFEGAKLQAEKDREVRVLPDIREAPLSHYATSSPSWVWSDLLTEESIKAIIDRVHETGRTVHISIVDTNNELPPNVKAPGFRADLSSDHTKDEEKPRLSDHSTLCWNNLFGPGGLLTEAAQAGAVTFGLIKALRFAGYGYGAEIDEALKQAATLETGADIHVVSMSFGGGGPDNYPEIFDSAPDNVLFVASAGNSGDGKGQSTVLYPAKLRNVLAIAAYDRTRTRSYFSSTGPELFCAGPGQNTPSRNYENDPVTWSGTSSACPNVAGVLALLCLYFDDLTSTEVVRKFLALYATDLADFGHDVMTGHGAVPIAPYLPQDPTPDEPEPPKDDEPEPLTIRIEGTIRILTE